MDTDEDTYRAEEVVKGSRGGERVTSGDGEAI